MTSLDQFISESARSYLQSVVYVDDNIYNLNGRPNEISPMGIPVSRDPFATADLVAGGEAPAKSDALDPKDGEIAALSDSADRLPEYHPKELVESFAEMGIVCALYEPPRDASVDTESQIFNLCHNADIVVLDWDLYNDGGTSASILLANLIKQSAEAQPHHLRLCSLYTNQPDLSGTASILLANLIAAGCTNVQREADKLQLASGATIISILGKPNVPGRPPEVESNYVVKERQLAERLLSDFCEMHKGLLSGLALKGLSSIRKNAKRLLDKFSRDLDGAFILHRALVMRDREALDELPELFADELSAILEDSLLSDFDSESVMNDIVDLLNLTNPEDGAQYVEASVRDQLKTGLDLKNAASIRRYGSIVGDADHSSSEKLGLLFNSRTQYLTVLPSLKFGTVLKHRTDHAGQWQYSICLMPICDSRNRSKTEDRPAYMTFPFWRLNPLSEGWPKGTGKKLAAFVVEDNRQTISLGVGGKIRDKLWLDDVRLSDDGWARPTLPAYKYETVDSTHELQWVAQLKPLHAQRIAAHVGTEASRIGLTESEWLKMLFDKG